MPEIQFLDRQGNIINPIGRPKKYLNDEERKEAQRMNLRRYRANARAGLPKKGDIIRDLQAKLNAIKQTLK